MTALSNLLALLSLDDSDYLAGLTSSKNATAGFGTQLSNIGGAVVVGALTAAATTIAAVGVAAWDAGETMDEAMDNISVATGAVGPELEALRVDFEAVFTSIPTDAESAAAAIGVLNSRLHATGPELQGIAAPLLEVSRLLGSDVAANAEKFTRVMGDWSLPLDDAASYLDALYVAAQETGAPLEQLMERVVQYGAPMRNFGFDFNQAAGILASFEAQGVNTEIVMSGLRTAQGKFISQGKDMATGLWETIDAIQNAESSTDALAIATETFGAKAAGDMFDTIRAGKFDIGDLVTTMMDADGAIMEASAELIGFNEKMDIFRNKMTTTLAPIGQSMEKGMTGAMDAVIGIFERPDVQAGLTRFTEMIGAFVTRAVEYIPVLIEGFLSFITFLQNNQGIVIGILAALGVAAMAWGITTAIAVWTALAPLLPVVAVLVAIAAIVYLVYKAWTDNFGGIRDIMTDFWNDRLKPIFDALKQWLGVAIPAALQFLSDLWNNTLLPALRAVWGFISANVLPLLKALGNLIGTYVVVYVRILAGIWQNVLWPAMKRSHEWFMANLYPGLRTFAGFLGGNFVTAVRAVSNVIQGLIGWIQRFAERLSRVQLPWWMTPGSPTPWETGLVGVQGTLDSLSRTTLPRFEAAVNLQPVGVEARSIDLQARSVSAETGAGFGQAGSESDDLLMRELLRTLRSLPDDIKRAVRDENLRRGG